MSQVDSKVLRARNKDLAQVLRERAQSCQNLEHQLQQVELVKASYVSSTISVKRHYEALSNEIQHIASMFPPTETPNTQHSANRDIGMNDLDVKTIDPVNGIFFSKYLSSDVAEESDVVEHVDEELEELLGKATKLPENQQMFGKIKSNQERYKSIYTNTEKGLRAQRKSLNKVSFYTYIISSPLPTKFSHTYNCTGNSTINGYCGILRPEPATGIYPVRRRTDSGSPAASILSNSATTPTTSNPR
jgi:uncharacterized protein YukE